MADQDRLRSRKAWATYLEAVFEARESERVGRATPAGLFLPSPLTDIHLLFDQVGLDRFRRVADLGSGDGRVVLLASLYTRAVGLEADPALVASARAQGLSLGMEGAEFRVADFMKDDLSEFDLLFIYPDKPLTGLAERLRGSYRGGLLVYGPLAQGLDLEVEAEFRLELGGARLFRV